MTTRDYIKKRNEGDKNMRKFKFVIVIAAVALALIYFNHERVNFTYFMANLLYEEANVGVTGGNIVFSKKSGFYEEEFDLSIWAPSAEIYYTLDGSEPTKESYRYEQPIRIFDASQNENTNSMRTDFSAYFLEEDSRYKIPDYLIDKCTVLKVAYYDDGQRSKTEERTYFVDYGEKSGYNDVSIISVTAEPESLFDPTVGIYVLGDTFEKYTQRVDYEKEQEYSWEANYKNSGREWEREAHIEVFNQNKQLVLSQQVGLRIQGGVSRAYYPKSLNIYARDEYGSNQMKYDFFGTGYYPQRVTLASGGNDYIGKIRDRIGAELTSNYNFCTMHYVPYVVFLNGEYWGFYYLTEKYDEHYIEHYYDIDKDNVIIVKQYELEAGMLEDYALYEEMRSFIEKADMTIDENYEKACTMIDMESFIDYYAAEIYMARNGDWPEANYALWRSRKVSPKAYEDGKWRWMLFDVNTSALHSDLEEHDTLAYVLEECRMFRNLSKNEKFKNDFANKLREMRDVVFTLEQVESKLGEYELLMSGPMENHMQRFFGNNNEKFFIESREVWAFACLRGEYIEDMLERNGFD